MLIFRESVYSQKSLFAKVSALNVIVECNKQGSVHLQKYHEERYVKGRTICKKKVSQFCDFCPISRKFFSQDLPNLMSKVFTQPAL